MQFVYTKILYIYVSNELITKNFHTHNLHTLTFYTRGITQKIPTTLSGGFFYYNSASYGFLVKGNLPCKFSNALYTGTSCGTASLYTTGVTLLT